MKEIDENQVEVLDQSIEIVEKGQRYALESIHENMGELIRQAKDIQISIDDKEQYDKAVELKRIIKATHVAVDKKTKELKAPILEMSKRLSSFSASLYDPLKKAEALVKSKMDVYEAEQERLKLVKKQEQDNIAKKAQELEKKLQNLNAYLLKINTATTISELDKIEADLDSQKLSEYGDRSDEAGFIITNMKMTCKIAKKAMPIKEVEPIPVVAKKVEPIPVVAKKVEPISDGELDFGQLADIKSNSNQDETLVNKNVNAKESDEREIIETNVLSLLDSLGINLTDMEVYNLAQEHIDSLFNELFVHNDKLLVTKK